MTQAKIKKNEEKTNKMNDHNSNRCVRCNNSETIEDNTAKDMPNKMKKHSNETKNSA